MNYNIIAGLRTDKKDKKGLAPVYIFIYEGSKLILKKSIGQKANPEFWNNESREVDKKYPNATLINSLISKEINELRIKILEEKLIKKDVNLPAMFQREKAKDLCFYEFSENQIKQKNYAKETRRAYRVYLSKIKEYKSSLKLSEIDYKFLQGYEAYLRDILKNEPNTIWGNFKFINTMCNDAIKLKYLPIGAQA